MTELPRPSYVTGADLIGALRKFTDSNGPEELGLEEGAITQLLEACYPEAYDQAVLEYGPANAPAALVLLGVSVGVMASRLRAVADAADSSTLEQVRAAYPPFEEQAAAAEKAAAELADEAER